MFIPTFNTLERLLKGIYDMLERASCVYIDEYKWYQLEVVVRTLRIENPEDINGLYLMDLNDEIFISEEGINYVLLYFDNLFKDDVAKILSSNVMPDVKDYSMYMSDQIKEQMLDFGICTSNIEIEDKEDNELVQSCSNRIIDYGSDKKNPFRKGRRKKWNQSK